MLNPEDLFNLVRPQKGNRMWKDQPGFLFQISDSCIPRLLDSWAAAFPKRRILNRCERRLVTLLSLTFCTPWIPGFLEKSRKCRHKAHDDPKMAPRWLRNGLQTQGSSAEIY